MTTAASPCLSVLVSADAAEIALERLFVAGATAVEERDGTTMTGAGGTDATCLVAGFADPAARDAAALALARDGVEAIPIDVMDDGWSAGWRAFFRPVELARLRIATPWMRVPDDGRSNIVIDPGLAFGTGGHATTRLVLRLLERRAAARGLPEAVLDVGSGSGVLAIAAVKLGAARAVAIDIDPESVAATAANAAANGAGAAVEARLGTAGAIPGEFPLVLANIELRAFAECAAEIAGRVVPGGELYVSGLLDDQVEACVALFPGFARDALLSEDGWAAVSLRRAP
jgi:ribosomal protein L11 methyltransferase